LLSHGLEPRSERAPLSRAGVVANAPAQTRSGTIHRYKVGAKRRERACATSHAPSPASLARRDLSHCVGEVYDDSRVGAANGCAV